jgi:hypothetical protein
MNVCRERKEPLPLLLLLADEPFANCPFRRVNPPLVAMVDDRMVVMGVLRLLNKVRAMLNSFRSDNEVVSFFVTWNIYEDINYCYIQGTRWLDYEVVQAEQVILLGDKFVLVHEDLRL